jgi:hypothetical protein
MQDWEAAADPAAGNGLPPWLAAMNRIERGATRISMENGPNAMRVAAASAR